MTRHLLSAGLLLGMLALMPVAASAAPHDAARYTTNERSNTYGRSNVYGGSNVFERGSFNVRARGGRREVPRFFSRGFSTFGHASAWGRYRNDRRR